MVPSEPSYPNVPLTASVFNNRPNDEVGWSSGIEKLDRTLTLSEQFRYRSACADCAGCDGSRLVGDVRNPSCHRGWLTCFGIYRICHDRIFFCLDRFFFQTNLENVMRA